MLVVPPLTCAEIAPSLPKQETVERIDNDAVNGVGSVNTMLLQMEFVPSLAHTL